MKRILGKVNETVVEQWDLNEYKNKKIVMYPEAKEHSREAHLKDYDSIEDYYYVIWILLKI